MLPAARRPFLPRPLLSPYDRPWVHGVLFLATLVSTTLAGGSWAARGFLYAQDVWFVWAGLPIGPSFLLDGLRFSVPLLAFLTAHEFGHYFAARHHRLDASLPYYIPFPAPPSYILSFGTFGAVIRLRSTFPSARVLFDVGAAGPLAGLVVALVLLAVALLSLPDPSYLQAMPGHELVNAHIAATGQFPSDLPPTELPLTLVPPALVALAGYLHPNFPPGYELYHYPTLLAAWLSLFFTAINLLPVGQLDGGHVVYALFGSRAHGRIARAVVALMLASGTLGAVAVLDDAPAWGPLLLQDFGVSPALAVAGAPWFTGLLFGLLGALLFGLLRRVFGALQGGLLAAVILAFGIVLVRFVPGAVSYGWLGWLLWGVLVVRVIRVDHPPVEDETALTPGRQLLGWLCLAAFALCFAPVPFRGG